MARRFDVKDLNELRQENIFLDTNIWLYLFCPLSNSRDHIVKKYSKAFHYLILSDNKLHIDVMILSEFINRYLRLAFHVYKRGNYEGSDFDYKKDYKQTDDFKENIQLIYSTIRNKILPRVSVVNFNHENKSMGELIDDLKEKMIDFNDLHFEKLCKTRGFILLTDDGDFSDSSIDIISGNPKILRHVPGDSG
jgi:predicted nucleic acid-binding protein